MERRLKAADKDAASDYYPVEVTTSAKDGLGDDTPMENLAEDIRRKGEATKVKGKIRLDAVAEMKAYLVPADGGPCFMLRRDSTSTDVDGQPLTGKGVLAHCTVNLGLTEKEGKAFELSLSQISKR
jgi:hypothetical protein